MKKPLSKLELLGIISASSLLACLCIFIFLLWYYPTIRHRLLRFFSSCCTTCWRSRIGKKKQDSVDEYNFSPRRGNNNLHSVSLGDVMINASLIFPTVTLANPVKHFTSDETSFQQSRRFSRKISTDINNTNGERNTIILHAKNLDASANNNTSTNPGVSNNHNNNNHHHPFSLSRRESKTNSDEEFNEELESQMTQSLYELEKIHKELVQTLELDQQSQDENDNNNPTEIDSAQSSTLIIIEKDKIINKSTDENLQPITENECTSKKVTNEDCNNESIAPLEEEQRTYNDNNEDMKISVLEDTENNKNIENSSDHFKTKTIEMTTTTLNTLSSFKEQTNKNKNDESNDNQHVETIENFGTNNNIDNNFNESKRSSIIIAVDATPKHTGGFMLIPDKQLCESYSVNTQLLPWRLKNMTKRGNSSEFEMKNLFFALLNWEEWICEYENIFLYTDNMGILENGLGSRQGLNVRSFIRHLTHCKNLTILNKNPYVHTYRNYKEFDKYIVPADHLSRRRFFQFKSHIQQHFPDITTFRTGFHKQKVEEKIENFIKHRCTTCKFRIRVTGSLRDTIKKKAKIVRNAIPDFTSENQQQKN